MKLQAQQVLSRLQPVTLEAVRMLRYASPEDH
jgi:hypothetical protein